MEFTHKVGDDLVQAKLKDGSSWLSQKIAHIDYLQIKKEAEEMTVNDFGDMNYTHIKPEKPSHEFQISSYVSDKSLCNSETPIIKTEKSLSINENSFSDPEKSSDDRVSEIFTPNNNVLIKKEIEQKMADIDAVDVDSMKLGKSSNTSKISSCVTETLVKTEKSLNNTENLSNNPENLLSDIRVSEIFTLNDSIQIKGETEEIAPDNDVNMDFLQSEKTKIFSLKVMIERIKIYECDSCMRGFLQERDYFSHCLTHMEWNKNDNESYVDYSSSKRLKTKQASLVKQKEKLKTVHKKSELNKTKVPVSEAKNELLQFLETSDKKFKCLKCNKLFKDRWKVKKHLESHSEDRPYLCHQCNKGFKNRFALVRHLKIHLGYKDFSCRYCYKLFMHAATLKIHERNHSGEKPYVCDYCKKGFSSKFILITHFKIHQGYKEFGCKYCDKRFLHAANLKQHEQVHTGNKPYECQQCGKKYYQNCKLKIHLKRHAGINDYICKYCNKGFPVQHLLSRHERCHTGDKPYKCKYCGKRFGKTSGLHQHIKTHTKPYACEICPMKFGEAKSLVRHKNKHLNINKSEKCPNKKPKVKLEVQSMEKNYECDYCKQRFAMRILVRNHIKRVHMRKEHKCNYCTKKLSTPHLLVSHVQKRHKNKIIYVCDCGKYYFLKNSLTRHRISKHGDKCV